MMQFPVTPLIANLETAPSFETLLQVMRSPAVSGPILHYFATDCVERAALRLRALGLSCDKQTTFMLHDKRVWLAKNAHLIPASSGVTGASFVSFLSDGDEEDLLPQAFGNPWDIVERATSWSVRHREKPLDIARQVSALARELISALFRPGLDHVMYLDETRVSALTEDEDRDALRQDWLEEEESWQCRRLAWWLSLSELTTRLWLAYEADCPLPIPPSIALDAGFA